MTEQQFLEICKSKYAELVKLKELQSFYEYEKQFDQIMTDLSRTLLEKSIGEVPADRRKKKFPLPLWENPNSQRP